jgi:FkbM family methyltransferase
VVTLQGVDAASARPALGRECRFVARGESLAAIEYFLEHEGVFYPSALPVETDQSVRLYLEAPGRYVLHAAWSSLRGERGWTQVEFQVAGAHGSTPQRVRVEGQRLWVPTPWDVELIRAHEPAVVRALEHLIRPGATVYDIGANVGQFSVRFARWVGADGWLYAIEPNPICVYFLRANLEELLTRNFTILPVAISTGRSNRSFSVNYGSSLIGVSGDSAVGGKPGHHIHVEGHSLDALIASLQLRLPDFIKLDVEGAEAASVAGMLGTLERNRPGLMIELHGREAAAATLRQLSHLRYAYLLCSTGARYRTAEDLLESLADRCVQIIACP